MRWCDTEISANKGTSNKGSKSIYGKFNKKNLVFLGLNPFQSSAERRVLRLRVSMISNSVLKWNICVLYLWYLSERAFINVAFLKSMYYFIILKIDGPPGDKFMFEDFLGHDRRNETSCKYPLVAPVVSCHREVHQFSISFWSVLW